MFKLWWRLLLNKFRVLHRIALAHFHLTPPCKYFAFYKRFPWRTYDEYFNFPVDMPRYVA
jgi:hypothetical protein